MFGPVKNDHQNVNSSQSGELKLGLDLGQTVEDTVYVEFCRLMGSLGFTENLISESPSSEDLRNVKSRSRSYGSLYHVCREGSDDLVALITWIEGCTCP